MAQVYKENLEEKLPDMAAAIASCDFIALDFEMSGISVKDKRRHPNYNDSPQERYEKMKDVVNQYSIIQLGICTFTKEGLGDQRRTVARPFNMYAFPATGKDVTMSVDAINFLKGHGMDFQTWIYRGVSFVDGPTEARLEQQLEKDKDYDTQQLMGGRPDGDRIKLSKTADKKWLETEMARIEKWLEKLEAKAGQDEEKGNGDGEEDEETEEEDATEEEGEEGEKAQDGVKEQGGEGKKGAKRSRRKRKSGKKANGAKESGTKENDGGEEEEVPTFCLTARANAFLRKVIREAIEDKWPGLVTETQGGQVRVMKLTDEEKAERLQVRHAERDAKHNAIVGLRRVIKLMCARGKPLVIHNGMYDLMFFFEAFIAPLPKLLKDFKTQLREAYPGPIYDTKIVASREDFHQVQLPDTTVEGLYDTLLKNDNYTKVQLAQGFEMYDTSREESRAYAHEAGFDAYMTGAIFARFRDDLLQTHHSKELQNRVYAYRSLFSNVLDGEDALMQRGHVFHVAISPAGRGVKSDDVMKVFGANSVHVNVLWVDEKEAFAVVDRSLQFDAAVAGMVPHAELHLTPFAAWWAAKKAAEEQEATQAAVGTQVANRGISGWIVDVLKRPLSFLKGGNGNGAAPQGGTSNGDISPGTQRGMKKARTF